MRQDEAGAGRCTEHRPAHHTSWVLSLGSSVPQHHLQPTGCLLLHRWSPGLKKNQIAKGKGGRGKHVALLNVPSLAAKIVDFAAGRALIYYWQHVRALALSRCTAHLRAHGFVAGILERSLEGARSWERAKTQRDISTEPSPAPLQTLVRPHPP